MNYFNRKNIAIIAIIVLLIVNISTISTIIYLRYKKPIYRRAATTERPYRELRKNMRLSQKQQRMFKEQGLKNKESATTAHFELENMRRQILNELSKSEPDTNILFDLTKKSSEVHMKLMKNNIKHLLELKRSWNPEQYEMLDKVFRNTLTSNEQSGPLKGQRRFRNHSSEDSTRIQRNRKKLID